MISHQDNSTYEEFVSFIQNQPEEDSIGYLKEMKNEECDAIALIQNKKKFNLIEVIRDTKKNKLLSAFIEKLSPETIEKSCWPIPPEGGTFDFMADNPNFQAFVDKIHYETLDKLVQNLGPHRKIDDICSLQIIAEHQSSEVFAYVLSQISYVTCQKLAPIFFNAFDVQYVKVENFNLFLKKITSIINEYVLSNEYENKRFISHLSNHQEYFFTLLDYLQTRSVTYILQNISLPDEAFASISLYKNFSDIFKANKNIGLKILSSAMTHPEILKKLKPNATQLKSIDFFDGGESEDLWSPISQSLFSYAPSIKPHPNRTNIMNDISKIIPNSKLASKIQWDNHTFLRVQGRTILFQNKEGNIIAVKVQKKNESIVELEKEYKTTFYLKQNAEKLNLKSAIPTPIVVEHQLINILEYVKSKISENDFKQFANMINNQLAHAAYIYEINPKQCDYFTYLHDALVSDEVFKKANRDIVHDLFLLLQKGMVFTQLADVFHNNENGHENRRDKGRYIVLINLLSNKNLGSGRLTGWKKAVQYPNLRVSGLADLGDCISLQGLTNHSAYSDKFPDFIFKVAETRGGNYLIGNVIAEYQYVLFLIIGCRAESLMCRAVEQKAPEQIIDDIWKKAATQILENCVYAASLLTQHSEEKIMEHFTSIIDVTRLSTQMRYWMTGEYIQDLMNNKVRNDIYEPKTKIDVSFKDFRVGTFHAKFGFSLNGTDQDLGAVNGQEPIKEVNNLIYRMVNYIFTSHHLLNETLSDLTKIIKEKDVKKSEKLRKESFSYLPEMLKDNIQFSLGKERLKKATLPNDIKSDIQKEQKRIASNKIRRFWRTHQSVKRIATMRENRRSLLST